MRLSDATDALSLAVHEVTVDPRNESLVYVSDVECSDGAYARVRCFLFVCPPLIGRCPMRR